MQTTKKTADQIETGDVVARFVDSAGIETVASAGYEAAFWTVVSVEPSENGVGYFIEWSNPASFGPCYYDATVFDVIA